MVKICASCCTVWAGGYRCLDCGAALIHTSDPRAKELSDVVWRNQRLDYGARRGMLVRFVAIFAGALFAIFGARASVPLDSPWCWLSAGLAFAGGALIWWIIHTAAGRGVRLWVLRKGQLHKRKFAKAMVAQVSPATEGRFEA